MKNSNDALLIASAILVALAGEKSEGAAEA